MACRFNYIVTVHNKEQLIERVLTAILFCAGENSHVYPVLDGCTDRSEAIIDDMIAAVDSLPVTKLYAPDVHEILSLNAALRQVPQDEDGYNILLQDDVILGDALFEDKVQTVYDHFGGRIGMLSFRHGVNIDLSDKKRKIRDADLTGSVYGQDGAAVPILPGQVGKRMVSVRSPECISTRTIREIGIFDEKYAPYTYDNYDYSLRCLRAGYYNYIYAVKFFSDIKWGGMRQNPQPHVRAIMSRNARFVYEDHAEFIRTLDREEFLRPAIDVTRHMPREDDAMAERRLSENRIRMKAYLAERRWGFDVRKLVERLPLKWRI